VITADGLCSRWLPIAHIEGMADDTRARFELALECRAEFDLNVLQEIQCDDGGAAYVRVVNVPFFKADEVFDAGAFGVFFCFGDAFRIDIYADGVGTVAFGGLDGDSAVAAAHVDEQVGWA
jgi:hypothetical protein